MIGLNNQSFNLLNLYVQNLIIPKRADNIGSFRYSKSTLFDTTGLNSSIKDLIVNFVGFGGTLLGILLSSFLGSQPCYSEKSFLLIFLINLSIQTHSSL